MKLSKRDLNSVVRRAQRAACDLADAGALLSHMGLKQASRTMHSISWDAANAVSQAIHDFDAAPADADREAGAPRQVVQPIRDALNPPPHSQSDGEP